MATPYRVPSISDIAYTRSRTPTSADITLNNLISFIESSQQLDQQKFTMQREEERYADRVAREEERYQAGIKREDKLRAEDEFNAAKIRNENKLREKSNQLNAEKRDLFDRVDRLSSDDDYIGLNAFLDSDYAKNRLDSSELTTLKESTSRKETKYNNTRTANSVINSFVLSKDKDWSTLATEEFATNMANASEDTIDHLLDVKQQEITNTFRHKANVRDDLKFKLTQQSSILTSIHNMRENLTASQLGAELTPEQKEALGYTQNTSITFGQHLDTTYTNVLNEISTLGLDEPVLVDNKGNPVKPPVLGKIGDKKFSEFVGSGQYNIENKDGKEAYLLDFMRNLVNDYTLELDSAAVEETIRKYNNGQFTITTDNDGNPVGIMPTPNNQAVGLWSGDINWIGGATASMKSITDPALTGEALKERLDKDVSLAISSGSVNAGFTVRHEASYNDDLIEAGQTPISNKKSRDVRNHASNEYQTREGWGTTSFIFNKMNTAFEAQQKSTSENRESQKARFDTTLEWGIDRLKNSLPTIKNIIAEVPESSSEKLEWQKLQARTVNQLAKIEFLSDETRKDYEESDLYNRKGLLDLSSNESFFQFISKYYGTRKSARTSTGQTDVMGRIQAADYTKYIHDTDILDISKFSPRVSGERMNPNIIEEGLYNLATDYGKGATRFGRNVKEGFKFNIPALSEPQRSSISNPGLEQLWKGKGPDVLKDFIQRIGF